MAETLKTHITNNRIMKRLAIIVMFAATLFGSVSCEKTGFYSEYQEKYKEKIEAENNRSAKRNPYKALNLSTKSAEFVQKGNAFSFDFIDRVNKSEDVKGDFITSPLSMQFLLGMVLDGAKGETADEICKVLGYGASEVDSVNAFCLSMLKQLPDLDKQTTLNIANAIVVNQDYTLLDNYKTNVSKFFEAEVSNMDFNDKLGTAAKINKWCYDHTNGLIPKIIDEADPRMLAYLMNALYFKSQWIESLKFSKDDTSTEPFTLENGSKKNVQMMKKPSVELRCNGNDVFSSVILPYGNGAYNMLVILPDEGHTLKDVSASLKGEAWPDFIKMAKFCDVDLWLPKFETTSSLTMNNILSAMGMPTAFNRSKADFTAMSKNALCLSYVQQDAVIKVDEEGTEAAAVTHGGMATTAMPDPNSHVIFHADKPFIYLIYESSTGAILFAGRYSGIE